MPTQKIVAEHETSMKKAVEFFADELKSVRTGRASTGLVENLCVDYYGTPTPLKQMASLAAPQSDLIVIKPFDPAALREIEKAIKNSDLSIAPVIDGKVVRLSIPSLSGERRKQMVTQAKHMGEQAKVSIRNIRRDANKVLDKEQKASVITEDDRDNGKKQIDEITKKYSEKVDTLVKNKSDEITLD